MNPIETIGDRIRAARAGLGLSQNELAERLHTQWQQVSRWERGLSEPRKHTRSELASALKVSLGWLISGEGPMVPSPFAGVTMDDFRGAAEKPEPYNQLVDLDLLRRVLLEVLTQAPTEPPERLADIATKAYDTAIRTQRLDRVVDIVRMLIS